LKRVLAMLCTAVYMRRYKNIQHKIAVIPPCFAKTDEFDATAVVSYNITFKKLSEYLRKNKVYELIKVKGKKSFIKSWPNLFGKNQYLHQVFDVAICSEGCNFGTACDAKASYSQTNPICLSRDYCFYMAIGTPTIKIPLAVFRVQTPVLSSLPRRPLLYCRWLSRNRQLWLH
jgi:hypothetical protein